VTAGAPSLDSYRRPSISGGRFPFGVRLIVPKRNDVRFPCHASESGDSISGNETIVGMVCVNGPRCSIQLPSRWLLLPHFSPNSDACHPRM
jgi:hypothetical protein